jgi:hypothetical protein
VAKAGGKAQDSGRWDIDPSHPRGSDMSKAKDTRKDLKKKPAKSLMEKRAAKKEKKATRLFRG